MNAYKLNGMAGFLTRNAIYKDLNILPSEIYKHVLNIDGNKIIHTIDGRKFKLKLKEIKDNE